VVECSEVVINMYPYLTVAVAVGVVSEQLDQIRIAESLELKLGESRGSVP